MNSKLEPSNTPLKTIPKNKQTEEKVSYDELSEIQNQLIETNEQLQIMEKVEENTKKEESIPSKKEHIFENKRNENSLEQKKQEEKQKNKPSLEIKDEESESPFSEEIKNDPVILNMSDTLEIEEEVSNKKIEIDNSEDFMTGLIPEEILNGGMSNFDEPGDDDFPDMDDPDDDTIDFA